MALHRIETEIKGKMRETSDHNAGFGLFPWHAAWNTCKPVGRVEATR